MELLPLALAAVGAVALALALFAVFAPRDENALALESGVVPEMEALPESTRSRPPRAFRDAVTDMVRTALHVTLGKRFERSQRGTRLAINLAAADFKLKPAEWILIVSGVCVVAAGLAAVRFGSLIALPIGAVAGYGACKLMLKIRQGRRRKLFDSQLAPSILGISNGLKAGYSFTQALDLTSRNAADPMAHELARVVREVQLGVSTGDALGRMVVRNQSDDLRLVMTAVQIQSQAGGNLAQILDNIEFTIRERVRIKGEIKTLTSQARASGWILALLPLVLAGFLAMAAPTYFDPMFSDGIGQVMLGAAGFSLLCGAAIIRRIVNVRV